MVYFSYFHLIMSYGIIFWGASPLHYTHTHTHKHAPPPPPKRIITNTRKEESYRKLFSTLHTFSLLCFVCNNIDGYIQNLDIHGTNTTYGSDFQYPTSNLAPYHHSTYFMGLKVLIVYHPIYRILNLQEVIPLCKDSIQPLFIM